MAASAALHAYGAKVEVSDDGNTYNPIAEISDCDPPNWLVNEAKATHLLSDDAMTESKPGIGKTDTGKLKLNFTKAQLNTFLGYFRLIKFWRFSLPLDVGETTPSRLVMIGYWTKLGMGKWDPEATQVIDCEVELTRSTKKPSFAPGT
jgi:hypothetical protein